MKRQTVMRRGDAARKIKTREPLVDGVKNQFHDSCERSSLDGLIEVPKDSHGRRMWRRLSDEQLIIYTKQFMKKNNITGKAELTELDASLYQALYNRGLVNRVGFEKWYGKWTKMSDEQIVACAKKIIQKEKIQNIKQLERKYPKLCNILRMRKLLGQAFEMREENGILIDKNGRRRWRDVDDETLVDHAKQVIKENEIDGRKQLRMFDNGLYKVVRQRKLLYRLFGLEKYGKRRNWRDMTDDEIIEYTRKIMEEKGIDGRKQLKILDQGLHKTLRKRNLLGQVFAEIEAQRNADGNKQAAVDMLNAAQELDAA